MELRRAADILLRKTPITSTILSKPRAARLPLQSVCSMCGYKPRLLHQSPNRTFTSSTTFHADEPPSNGRPPDETDFWGKQLASMPPSTGRAGSFPSASRVPPRSSPSEPRSLLTFLSSTSSRTPSSAENFQSLFARDTQLRQNSPSRSRIDFSEMNMPESTGLPVMPTLPPEPAPVLRLGPPAGRSVPVDVRKGADLARSFRLLDMTVARNGVRRDFQKQRFHERAGLRRKRLKSERWRTRFKVGFQAVVANVDKMRRQGW